MEISKERKEQEKIRNRVARKQKLLQYRRSLQSKIPSIRKYFIIIIILAILTYLLVGTSIVSIKDVSVTSTEKDGFINIDPIAVETYSIEKIEGQNFFANNPNLLIIQLKKEFPFIQDIFPEKKFPNSLLLRIKEKKITYLVEFEGICTLFDKEGKPIIELGSEIGCVQLSDDYSAIYTKIDENFYDSILTQQGFFIFDQLIQLDSVMNDLGYDIVSVVVTERKISIKDDIGHTFIFDPFEEFNTQLKRAVLVLNQVDPNSTFTEIDFRFQRPVQR